MRIAPTAQGSRNFTQCDSCFHGYLWGAYLPSIEGKIDACQVEHEASTSSVSEEVKHYCLSRGLDEERLWPWWSMVFVSVSFRSCPWSLR